jgi:hypothetical protein
MTSNSQTTVASKNNRPRHEVADILFRFWKSYQQNHPLTRSQKRIAEDIMFCRSAGMGGHFNRCDHCRHVEISYNSCRNRHCPKCQSLAKADWLEQRQADILPTPYLHTVFTLPHDLNDLILRNKKQLLNLLFAAVKKTFSIFTHDPKHQLLGTLGYTAVLHTWDQRMNCHYHLHCLIPAGVYQPESLTWVPARYKFLFPVKALSEVFRGIYIRLLRKAYEKGALEFFGQLAPLAEPKAFANLLTRLRQKDWVVFSKPPFKSPGFVLDYLGRYTHRVAISNHRIKQIDGKRVLFSYKKRQFKGKQYVCQTQLCNLDGETFIRRFLLHELPSGFMRIRHFGFLGNNGKQDRLFEIREAIGFSGPPPKRPEKRSTAQRMLELTGIDITLCKRCKLGRLRKVSEFEGVYRKTLPFFQRVVGALE